MKRTRTLFFAAVAVAATSLPHAAGASPAPGGKLATLPLGEYVCSLPGDAASSAWIVLPAKGFTIGNGSTYHTSDGAGTYLLVGETVQFTRGPMKGMKFQRTANATLRWLDEDGEPGRVRCVRSSATR